MNKLFNYFILIFFSTLASSQNVLKENSWIISGAKKNVYFEQGIFRFSGDPAAQVPAVLQNLRTHFNKNTKQERIVIDLTGTSMVGLYGSILPGKKKITLDLMQVSKGDSLPVATKGKYLQSIDIYIIEPKLLTLELNFDAVYSFEIFYLLNPLRVVIDVKR
jgi:hypothetical protein